MKRLISKPVKCLVVGTTLSLGIATFAEAQTRPDMVQTLTLPQRHGVSQVHQSFRASAAPLTGAAVTLPASVIPAVCPEAGAVCGYLPVPLDRNHPKDGTIAIYFEVYPHTNPGSAQSAILMNFGGPAVSTTNYRDFAQFLLFASNLDVHDLLLIDDRGSGLSATIDCEELQHGTAPFAQAESDCAAQLGAAASRYGSGDVAEDMDAVRAALGYEQVDYFGASYGGAEVTAYATRFGEHLRSVVLDAPIGANAVNEFTRLQFRVHSDPRMVRLVCARSLICAPDHRDANEELAQLIEAIQDQPIEGNTHDASGNPVHVRVDEDALLNFVITYPLNFINTGEILAAGAALAQGDSAPLLRLAAEGSFTLVGDSGDPTASSSGDYYARLCVDAQEPWDWSDSIPERKEDYAQAVSKLPADYFAPFPNSAPTGILFSTAGKQCLWWQKPTPSSPMVPSHAVYPQVPTLVLDGDIDNRVPLEESEGVADLFPNSTFVKVAEAAHETVFNSPCADNLAAQFIENLTPGDTSCAKTPYLVFPAVGTFPLFAREARPADIDPTSSNRIRLSERKVVTVTVATAIDALQRSIIGSGVGVGLRAGTFQTAYGAAWTTTLAGCAFATDVKVSGTITWGAFTDYSVVADLVVTGAGTAGGTLHVTGFWNFPGPVGYFKVTGTLGGKQVAVLVPEA
jgi:pimeloyl-ACP methyl ester carboxylesterase